MIFGFGAAVSWGVADLLTAVVGRRMGSFVALVAAQITAALVLAVIFLFVQPAVTATASDLLIVSLSGGVAAFGYVFVFRALELGPVALVSPIVSSFGAIAVVLALVILKEALPGLALAGAAATLCGVVLATLDPRRLRPERQAGGVPYALVTAGCFGLAAFLLGRGAQGAGWLVTVGFSRLATITVLAVLAIVARNRFRGMDSRALPAAALIGLVDLLGVALYSRGAELGMVSIVAAVSATFTLIPVIGGVVAFRERPAASQWLGVAMVVGGLVMLGLGR
ncbi:MAG: EamA family transporter [Actinomycetota bacterium]